MINRRTAVSGLLGLGVLAGAGSLAVPPHVRRAAAQLVAAPVASVPSGEARVFHRAEGRAAKLVLAAEKQIGETLYYDASYAVIGYPNGDVPRQYGVCTDVIIRAYRDGLGIDLQTLVHDDMRDHFGDYPRIWGLKRADRNIDHRRVPNLETFFRRQSSSLPVSDRASDYLPGDIVTQRLPNGRPHVVLVGHRASADGERPLCIHNIGAGARLDDVLFAFRIAGHFRFSGMT